MTQMCGFLGSPQFGSLWDPNHFSKNLHPTKESFLQVIISNGATFHIANLFYGKTSTFFMALEHVVPRVKPNGHTCSTSLDLCRPRVRLETLPHVRERVERINLTSKKKCLKKK